MKRFAILIALVAALSPMPVGAAIFVDNATQGGCSNGSTNYKPADRTCGSGGTDTVYTSLNNAHSAISAGSSGSPTVVNVRYSTYYEQLNISKNYTTWQRYTGDNKPVLDGQWIRPTKDQGIIYMTGRTGVTIDGLAFTKTKSGTYGGANAIRFDSSNYITVTNCNMTEIGDAAIMALWAGVGHLIEGNYIYRAGYAITEGSWSPSISLRRGTTYSIVRNNMLENIWNEGIQTDEDCAYNIIEHNTIKNCTRVAIYFPAASRETIRYNLIYNTNSDPEFLNGTFGAIGIAMTSENPGYNNGTGYNVYGNMIAGMSVGIFIDRHPSAPSWQLSNSKFYNNTIIESVRAPDQWGTQAAGIEIRTATGDPIGAGVEIKNNSVWQTSGYTANDPGTGISYSSNLWSKAPTSAAQASSDPRYPTYSSISIADYFNKQSGWLSLSTLAATDFDLRSSATHALDTGSWLTNITSSTGSGTSFVVASPWYFIAGDVIRVQGNANAVTVQSVNYSTGQITVNSSVSWSQTPPAQTGVALNFAGALPDLGAREYGSAPPPPPPGGAWTILAVDSEELVGENGAAANAIDGNTGTIWHTEWAECGASCPGHPHTIDIQIADNPISIYQLTYLPRQDGSTNGTITQYEIYVSTDGVSWGSSVASGAWAATTAMKTAEFEPVSAKYIRLKSITAMQGAIWASAAEISVVQYSGGGGGGGSLFDGLIGQWNFVDGSGSATVGPNWSLTGTTSAAADRTPTADQAISCVGSANDYIVIADGTAPEFGDGAFSLCVWVYPTANTSWHPFLSKFGSSWGWAFGLEDQQWEWYQSHTGDWEDGVSILWDTGGAIATNTWYHACFTSGGSGGSGKLYIDSTLRDTETVAGIYNGTDSLRGFRPHETGGGYQYSGRLDDMLIWNRELTGDEIAAVYALDPNFGGGGGTTPKTMGVTGPAKVLGVPGPGKVLGVGN